MISGAFLTRFCIALVFAVEYLFYIDIADFFTNLVGGDIVFLQNVEFCDAVLRVAKQKLAVLEGRFPFFICKIAEHSSVCWFSFSVISDIGYIISLGDF